MLRSFVSLTQLGKLYLEREEYGKLQKILRQLHQSCQVRRSICNTRLYVHNIPASLWLHPHYLYETSRAQIILSLWI